MDNLMLDQSSIPTIRPDIARITEMELTIAGKCWLHAFTVGTIKAGVDVLKQQLESTKMNEKDKWYTLFNACRKYAERSNVKINWKVAYDMLKEQGVTKDDLEYFGGETSKGKSSTKVAKEYTAEEWKDCPTDRIAYAHMCHSFEESRTDLKYNPYWTYMYPSWKKRMMDKFPVLKEIYPKDAAFCAGLKDDPEFEHPHPVTDIEHAENIICAMQGDLEEYKRMNIGLTKHTPLFNPWWAKLDATQQTALLVKYPWYTQYVSKTPSAEEFFKKLAETMETHEETDESVLT